MLNDELLRRIRELKESQGIGLSIETKPTNPQTLALLREIEILKEMGGDRKDTSAFSDPFSEDSHKYNEHSKLKSYYYETTPKEDPFWTPKPLKEDLWKPITLREDKTDWLRSRDEERRRRDEERADWLRSRDEERRRRDEERADWLRSRDEERISMDDVIIISKKEEIYLNQRPKERLDSRRASDKLLADIKAREFSPLLRFDNLESPLLNEDALNPFRFQTTQDQRVVEIATKIVTSPGYIESEARAIIKTAPHIYAPAELLARIRYDSFAARQIAKAMSSFSTFSGILTLKQEKVPIAGIPEEVRAQIDKVNYCQEQVYGTIKTGKVRDSYVSGVAQKIDGVLSSEEQSNLIKLMKKGE